MNDCRRTIGLGESTAPECQGSEPGTNYCDGFLRGWSRIFLRKGGFMTIDPRSQNKNSPAPQGEQPSLEEWAAFDAEAQRRGVAGYVLSIKKHARPSTGFLSSFSRALSTIGRSLEKGDLFKAVGGAQAALTTVTSQLDQFVPGSGAVIGNLITGALMPILPFAPLLTSTLGTIAGNVPLVGAVAGPLVQSAGTAGKGFVEGARGYGVLEPTGSFSIATQQQINNGLLQSLSDFAVNNARDLGTLKQSLIKLNETFRKTNGDLAAKLLATGREAWNELQFAISLAGIIATGGGLIGLEVAAAPASLETALADGKAIADLAMNAVDAGIKVSDALDAARRVRSAADDAKRQGQTRLDELDAEERAIKDAIAQIQAQRKAVRARRPALVAANSGSGTSALLLALAGVVAIEVLA